MNPLIKFNSMSLSAEQVEKLVSPVCSECWSPIIQSRNSQTGWKHIHTPESAAVRCYEFPEPACEASPATEATTFALKYVHEQRLPAWVLEHVANAYSFGEMEGIKRGRAE